MSREEKLKQLLEIYTKMALPYNVSATVLSSVRCTNAKIITGNVRQWQT